MTSVCSAVVGGAGLWSRSAGREGGGMSAVRVVRELLGGLDGEFTNLCTLELSLEK